MISEVLVDPVVFPGQPQAEGRRSELLTALRDHQQCDEETGLPAGELRARTTPSTPDR
ncbi:hypothetical protein [Streptomyces akebiae]|uniref:Uncharacterized protein n=1 Tax=Streptomyces akebiae TaxID=2865673 RepID=A0ABX8XTH8_9ACTN|nr:hypothetical protein [Streptomyces akebiae]QYX78912.1 hypothetical protein K1J60_22395 [Streptomyces akebiae]